MDQYELPLVFFTVLSQWGIGGVLALTLYRLSTVQSDKAGLSLQQFKTLALALWLIEVLGSSLSLAHLGSPAGAYRAILGINHSWLSREAVAFVLLNGCMLLWLLTCWRRPQQTALISVLGLLSVVVGTGAILASAQIYSQMVGHSLWHAPFTQLAFLGTPVLLGFTTLGIVLNVCGLVVPRIIRYGILLGILLVIGALIGRYQIAEASAAGLLLWWQLCAGILVSAALFTLLRSGARFSPAVGLLAGIAVVSGELVGRMLFYSSVMGQLPLF
ncbi:dimethyl sulfoxide reductase anchor subunit [Yersinia frederiksenii]|uniref:dimethyl sulfoxide reductase anchor subunit family protein n=1 Tax=Yersinia frederiksenii TaxID=29484 RepID=UPI0025AACCBD|nr:DmsC/YnfH family molybdoenzyme membrane anchor subunit [Yersinia frederiksenii]MDN0120081.1 dimethyl sulfoxide reductase anchor subunit [Yersinia frederiksenii]